ELMVGNFLGDVQVGCGRADGRQLVAEVGVHSLEPFRKPDVGRAAAVESSVSGVEVHHFGGLHRSVIQVLVAWVERMIDAEVLDPCKDLSRYPEIPNNVHVPATEEARVSEPLRPAACVNIDSVTAGGAKAAVASD